MPVNEMKLKQAPLIVEIVGPAGAGKTTVLSTLRQHDEQLQPIFHLRRIKHLPFYAGYTLSLLPELLCQFYEGRRFTLHELKWMVRLKVSNQILKPMALKDGSIIIVDQGPIYTLVRLAEHGSKRCEGQCFQRWWNEMLRECAATLDLVIWLDAPTEILMKRVHSRAKYHAVKKKSGREAKDLLAYHRRLYHKVIAELTAEGSPKVRRYDTNQYALDQIVDKTLAVFNPVLNHH